MFNNEDIKNLNSKDGWKWFVENYSDLVYAIILKKGYKEDIVADIYCYVIEELNKNNLKKLKSFKGLSKFSSWLTSVINNLISDYYRRIKHIPTVSIDDEERKVVIKDVSANPENEVAKKQAKENKENIIKILKQEMEKLPTEDQLIIKYRFEHNLKFQEIANLMNLKTNDVYYTIKKLLENLKQALLKNGFSEEDFKDILEYLGEN